MSVEQAKAFIERMKTDEAFREKVMSIERCRRTDRLHTERRVRVHRGGDQ